MREIIKRLFLTVAVIIVWAFNALSGPAIVRAKLDSTTLVMGKIGILRLEVEQDKGKRGDFPLFRSMAERGYAGVCGDSVELRAPSKIDTIEKGDRILIQYQVPVQSFDSGYYKLPEIAYAIDRDTSYTGSVALKVLPVNVTEKDPISDYAGVSDPENPSIFDLIPDWVIEYFWIFELLILLVAIWLWLRHRYRKTGSILPQKPLPSPYEVAISSLYGLKERKLWEHGAEKEYYTELTDILREYLNSRFGINAMEKTSREIMSALGKNPETKDKRNYLRQILSIADFVKFAKIRPLPDDCVQSYDNAYDFITATKPVPVLEENKEENEGAAPASVKTEKVLKFKITDKKKGGSK